METIPSQRHRFTIPNTVHYLNCAYMAPLAHSVSEAIEQGARLKQQPWQFQPKDFFAVCEDYRERAARLADVATDTIAIVPSVSYAMAIAARNLPLSAGQNVVTLADQFPSNIYVWRELAEAAGATMATAQRDSDECWTASVLDAIGPNTAIVAVPHCHWADGRLVDLEAVGQKARKMGAGLVLDLTQSLGAMPIDFRAVQPDFAVAASYKWLMGPYGTAMLYVDPKHHGGEPVEHNWMNRAGSEDFSRLIDYRDDFQPGARRFDMGEKANPPLLGGASAALDFLLEFGVDAIARSLWEQTEAIAQEAIKLGLSSATPGTRAAHFLSLEFPGGMPNGLTDQLRLKNVHVSARGSSLRVTPHLYNTQADADALIEVLRRA